VRTDGRFLSHACVPPHSGDISNAFLSRLSAHPVSSWPALLSFLAYSPAAWEPLRQPHQREHGRALLAFLIQRTSTRDDAPTADDARVQTQQPQLTQEQLARCVQPFLQRMETQGFVTCKTGRAAHSSRSKLIVLLLCCCPCALWCRHLVECMEWFSALETAFSSGKGAPVLLALWPLGSLCAAANLRVVAQTMKRQPNVTPQELRVRGLETLDGATAWRTDFRRRNRLPHSNELKFTKALEAIQAQQ